jgi:hypothetical protein
VPHVFDERPVPDAKGGPVSVNIAVITSGDVGGVAQVFAEAAAHPASRVRGPVRIIALGNPDQDIFRPVRAPYSLVPTSPPTDTSEERVFNSIDDLEAGWSKIADWSTSFHTQDPRTRRDTLRRWAL